MEHADRFTAKQWLGLGFGLSFVHLFWYAHPATAWLALVCYSPFLVWLDRYCKRPFLAGVLFGLWYALLNMTWLGQFVGRWTSSLAIGVFVVLIVGLIWGSFYGVGCVVVKRLQKRVTHLYGVYCVVVFGLLEIGRTMIPQLEFPFTMFGDPMVAYPLTAFCWSNQLIATLSVIAVNALLPFAPAKLPSSILAAVVLVPAVVEILKGGHSSTKIGLRIGLGQLGFDMAYGDSASEPYLVRDAVNRLSVEAKVQRVDVMILPEAVASFTDQPVTPFDLSPDLKVIFGAGRGTSPRYQSAFLWDGRKFTYTDKLNLVVFGEYVPFRGIIPYPAGFQLPSGDLAPGTKRVALEVKPGVKIGGLICFESLFGGAGRDVTRKGANLIAIMSLDDWYVGTSAIPRLVVAARWRAVENQKWVVRVGSLGKTMVIDPSGKVVDELPIGQQGLLVADL
jgi:apolipoprotein N-acyltransferase